jgi:hypothetical protein
MEIDKTRREFVLTPDEEKLLDPSNPYGGRIPFSLAQALLEKAIDVHNRYASWEPSTEYPTSAALQGKRKEKQIALDITGEVITQLDPYIDSSIISSEAESWLRSQS